MEVSGTYGGSYVSCFSSAASPRLASGCGPEGGGQAHGKLGARWARAPWLRNPGLPSGLRCPNGMACMCRGTMSAPVRHARPALTGAYPLPPGSGPRRASGLQLSVGRDGEPAGAQPVPPRVWLHEGIWATSGCSGRGSAGAQPAPPLGYMKVGGVGASGCSGQGSAGAQPVPLRVWLHEGG